MKILYITEDYTIKSYGVFSAIKNQVNLLKEYIKIDVVSITSSTIIKQHFCANKFWMYSKNFNKFLEKIINNYSVLHIHGIWKYPQYIGLKLAIKHKIPSVISFHGMLEPWLMSIDNIGILKFLKKNLYLKLITLPLFKKASIMHAITDLEKIHLKKYFPHNKTVVIPNAINLENIDKSLNKLKIINPEKYILFIGRLHPVKGIELLIEAFNKLCRDSNIDSRWKLKIVGPEEDKKYVNFLKNLSKKNKNIEFLGEIFGEEKIKLYKNAWVTVVPSYSEVIGMVNLESGACYTPTITTYQTGLLQWEQGGNILINPNTKELLEALHEIMTWSFKKRIKKGKQVRIYIEKNFSAYVVKHMWLNLYKKLLTN